MEETPDDIRSNLLEEESFDMKKEWVILESVES